MQLGVAAAEVEPVGLGQCAVAQRAPVDDPGAGFLEQFQIFTVVELEGLIARHGDGHGGRAPSRPSRIRGPPLDPTARGPEQRVDVDVLLDQLRESAAQRGGVAPLGGGDEAQVALGEDERALVGQGAQHAALAGLGDGVAKPLPVDRATRAIEDDAGQLHVGIEALEAQQHRGGAPGHGARVQHQHDGRAQPLGDLGGGTRLARALEPVEAAHDPLDHREVGIGRVPSHRRHGVVVPAHPAIEVVRGAPGGEGVEARVDEVGTHLEPLHGQSPTAQRLQDSERDGGLSHPARHPGDDEGRDPW